MEAIFVFMDKQCPRNMTGESLLMVRAYILRDLGIDIPTDAPILVYTMDPDNELFRSQPGEARQALVTRRTENGTALVQCHAKIVPDDYVLQTNDFLVVFQDKP